MKCKGVNLVLLLIMLVALCLNSQLESSTARSRSSYENNSNQGEKLELAKKIFEEFQNEGKSPNTDTQLSALEMAKKKKSKGRKGKKVNKKRPAPPKYKIVKTTNKLLASIGKKKMQMHIFYRRCSVKTGFLNIVKSRPNPPKNLIIKVLPIYIRLTTKSLSIYQAPKTKKPLSVFDLNNILRIDQHYLKTNCFDVITTKLGKDKSMKQGVLTLCAENKKQRKEWVLEILEFKRCLIPGRRNVDHNRVTVLDFDKLNLAKRRDDLKKYQLSHLMYDGKDGAFKKRKPGHEQYSKVSRITKIFEEMNKSIVRGDLAAQQTRRQFIGKLRKARTFNTNVTHRQALLQRRYARKIMREKEIESRKLRRIHKKKEMRLIRLALNKIEHIKESEVQSLKSSFEHQIHMMKNAARAQARNMMNLVEEQDKLTDYSTCSHRKLKGFKKKRFVRKVCKHYYGEHGRETCATKTSFCQMCCQYHIGLNFPGQRLSCRRKCEDVINHKDKKKKGKHKKGRKSKKAKPLKKGGKSKRGKKGKSKNKTKTKKNIKA